MKFNEERRLAYRVMLPIKLTIQNGPTKLRELNLRATKTVIGRSKDCDLRIPIGEISRRHCVLICEEDGLHVEDLQSANGTYLNGERITGKQMIRPGDRLEVGPLTFAIEYPPSQAAAGDLPVAELLDDELAGVVSSAQELIKTQPKPPGGRRSAKPAANQEEEPPSIDLDKETLHLPEGEDFRDILSHLDS